MRTVTNTDSPGSLLTDFRGVTASPSGRGSQNRRTARIRKGIHGFTTPGKGGLR